MSIGYTNRAVARTALAMLGLVTALSVFAPPPAHGQTSDAERSGKSVLPIKNDRFAAGGTAEQPIADWTFECLAVDADPDAATWNVKVQSSGATTVAVPPDGRGVVLQGSTDTARGDLVSAAFPLKPFRWVKVGVEYAIESGDPGLFVCLRPTKNREQVDLEFLPKTPPGEKRKAFVRLHSGALDGEYSVSVSLIGAGTARVFVLKAREEGDYPRPGRPALVIDLMHNPPVTAGPYAWDSIQKLVTVFGFPSLEFLSYVDVTPEKLRAIDPAVILFSPYADRSQNPDRQKTVEAIRAAVSFGAPLIGVGLGHQVLGWAYHEVKMARGAEFGPTRIEVTVDDPIFAGLPRGSYFLASESHNSIVRAAPPGAEIIATSENALTQVFRYPGKRCYTFQANLECDWEYSCPEACIVWKNMLCGWGLISPIATP